MRKKALLWVAGCGAAMVLLSCFPNMVFNGQGVPVAGDPFPRQVLPSPDAAQDRLYLGLTGEEGTFYLEEVKGGLVLVEALNVYCSHCQVQTGPYNRLFARIEADPRTRGRIKLLGVAVGNNAEEVAAFRRKYKVAFPVLPDPKFQAHRSLGGVPTPWSLYVRKEGGEERAVVAGTHRGTDLDDAALFVRLRRLLQTDLSALRQQKAEAGKAPEAKLPRPPISDAALRAKVKEAFRAFPGTVRDLEAIPLVSDRTVFTARLEGEGEPRRLFASVISRPSVCDVCHDVHFFYLFDPSGQVVAFEPLQLTKYGNALWGAANVEHMRRRVVGRSLRGAWRFDPQVDAVTSATITSSLIFDSLDQERGLLEELHGEGWL